MRKDGRPLVTKYPVTAMDEIEYLGKVDIPDDATVCRKRREPEYEAWMDDI